MRKVAVVVVLLMLFGMFSVGFAMEKHQGKDKVAIMLACFGTTYPQALKGVTNVRDGVMKAFPGVKVEIAFTSNIIRNIWHKRQNDKEFLKKYKDAAQFINIRGILGTMAELQENGYKTIVVQPTHLYTGEQFVDLNSYINALKSIRTIKTKWMPFNKIVVGRPLMGTWGDKYDYHEDMKILAKALNSDVEHARKEKAALVYMGHGNEYFSTGAYIEFQQVMRNMYPGVKIFVGTVEGFPSLDDVLDSLKHYDVKKVLLKPLMDSAGDHARNDMAGADKDSWKSRMEARGIKVVPVLHGLGEMNSVVNIFVQHIRDAAKDGGIVLK